MGGGGAGVSVCSRRRKNVIKLKQGKLRGVESQMRLEVKKVTTSSSVETIQTNLLFMRIFQDH